MKKIWVLKASGDSFYGYLFRKGETFRVEGPQEVSLRTLRGEKVLLLVEDQHAYFHREVFTRGPKEIIALQINERLRNLGLLEGTPRLAFRIEETEGSLVTVSYLALPAVELEEEVERLVSAEVRLYGVQHHAVALAGLARLVTPDPLFLVEANEEGLWVVVCQGEKLLYLRHFAAGEASGLSTSHVEEALLAALDFAHRGLKKEIKKILPLGTKRDLIPSLPHLETISPEGLPFKENREKILLEPAFFGALYAPKDFDLTPEEHRLWLKHLRPARYAALAFLSLAFFNLLGWFHFSHQAQRLHHRVELLQQEVQAKQNHLQSLLAGREDDLHRLVELRKRFEQEPRLDFFLAWLAQNLPSRARLKSFKAQREPQGMKVQLEILCQGPFSEVQQAFWRFSRRLSAQNTWQNSRLAYDEEQKKGVFSFEFILKGS